MRLVVSILALGVCLQGADVPYPAGYRQWTHVKSTLIGPQHPRFAANGGLHHFYANEKALEGYRTGKFPDGAVLVDDLLEIKDIGGGITAESTRRRVASVTVPVPFSTYETVVVETSASAATCLIVVAMPRRLKR